MDKDGAVAALQAATKRAAATCDGVDEAVWFTRCAGGYSMADVVEHMADAAGQILGALHRAVARGPRPQPFATIADEDVPYAFDRAGEPPGSGPSAAPLVQAEAMTRLRARSHEMAAWSAGIADDLRLRGLTHPKYGSLDGVQWLLLAVAHIEQHRTDLMALRRESEAA